VLRVLAFLFPGTEAQHLSCLCSDRVVVQRHTCSTKKPQSGLPSLAGSGWSFIRVNAGKVHFAARSGRTRGRISWQAESSRLPPPQLWRLPLASFTIACQCHELSVAATAAATTASSGLANQSQPRQQLAELLQQSIAMATGMCTVEWLAGYCVFLMKRHGLAHLLGKQAFKTAMEDGLMERERGFKRRRKVGTRGGSSRNRGSGAKNLQLSAAGMLPGALRRSQTAQIGQRGLAHASPRRHKSA
jgi:hypothetical protein